jgi:hypothetical protein
MEARPSSEARMDLANERLHAAAQSGDLEQLQVTLGHPAPCGRCSIKRPGCVCCSCGWERGPSSRTKTGTALHSALAHGTRTGSFDCRLRPLGVFSHAQQSSPHATVARVVRDGRTALALAAVAGHSPVVALLIDAGADLNVKSNTG